jgi:hypothetical protein
MVLWDSRPGLIRSNPGLISWRYIILLVSFPFKGHCCKIGLLWDSSYIIPVPNIICENFPVPSDKTFDKLVNYQPSKMFSHNLQMELCKIILLQQQQHVLQDTEKLFRINMLVTHIL